MIFDGFPRTIAQAEALKKMLAERGQEVLSLIHILLDQVVNSARQSVQFFIISDKYEEIAKHIQVYPHRGATVINASGFYTCLLYTSDLHVF